MPEDRTINNIKTEKKNIIKNLNLLIELVSDKGIFNFFVFYC